MYSIYCTEQCTPETTDLKIGLCCYAIKFGKKSPLRTESEDI